MTIAFRGGDLGPWLTGRAARAATGESPSLRAKTEIRLWRLHLAVELSRQRWTLNEIGFLAEVHNGVIPADTVAAGGVIDAVVANPDVYGERWGLDEDALVARLSRMGPTAATALLDAIARWWAENLDHTIVGWGLVGVRISAEAT